MPDSGKYADHAEPAGPPPQYGPGRCVCGTKLSTYNPYWTCGPCRARTTAAVAAAIAEGGGDEMPRVTYPWEKRAQRRVRRVGPLLGADGNVAA